MASAEGVRVIGPLLRPEGALCLGTVGGILSAVAALGGEERFTVDLSGVTAVEPGAGPALLAAVGRLRRAGVRLWLTGTEALAVRSGGRP